MLKHNVVPDIEYAYSVKPPVAADDLLFTQKLNRRVREEALAACRNSPVSPFTFEIGNLIGVSVTPLPSGVFIDPAVTRITVRRQENKSSKDGEFFASEIRYPHPAFEGRINRLLGIDPIIDEVKGILTSLLPGDLESWAARHYPSQQVDLRSELDGTPALLFYGDPGVGKTALATCIGDWLARASGYPVQLLKLDMRVRGSGHVGELTRNISDVWRKVVERHLSTDGVTLFLIDEADAVVQSRAHDQQHHEDLAGVDTIIQQLDQHNHLRIVVILITNLIDRTDPAVRRRAVHKFCFPRPNLEIRRQLFNKPLLRLIPAVVLDEMAELTEGYTPSDIQAMYAAAVRRARRADSPITEAILWDVLSSSQPTPSVK